MQVHRKEVIREFTVSQFFLKQHAFFLSITLSFQLQLSLWCGCCDIAIFHVRGALGCGSFWAITKTSTFVTRLYEAYNSLLYISSLSLSLPCAIVYTRTQLGVSTFQVDSSLSRPDDTVPSRA